MLVYWQKKEEKQIILPIPQIQINPVDISTGSQYNKINNYPKNSPISVVDVTRANDTYKLGIQLKISEWQNLEWLNYSPMIFMHTLKNRYPDYRNEVSNSWNRITHIPNTPNGIVSGSWNWWNKVDLEPLNRTWTNYWWGHMRWFGSYSWWTVPMITSERKLTINDKWWIQVVELNWFELGYRWLSTATFPIRIRDVDGRYTDRTRNNGISNGLGYEPRVKIPLRFTFAYIDPNDGKSVIESEYSECVELYVKAQELERDWNTTTRWDTYLIDWAARIRR